MLGPVLGGVLSLLSIPLLAWHFHPEEIGRNGVFQIFLSFSLMIFSLGLDQAYVREYHEAEDRQGLFKKCFSVGFVLLVIVVFATIPFFEKISKFLYGEANLAWHLLTCGCLLLSFASRFFSLVVRMQERGLAYSMSQILPKLALLGLVLIYVAAGAGKNYENLLYANFFALLVTTVIFGINSRADWMPKAEGGWDKKEIKRLLSFGLPLVGSGLIYWALSATSVLALRTFSGFKEVAIYSMAMNFAGIGVLLQSIFSTIWMPTVYKWVATKQDLAKIEIVTNHVLLLICLLFSLVGLFAWTIDYVVPVAYLEVKFIVVCCMAQPLLYTLSEATVVGLNIQKKTSYSLIASAAAFVTNVVLCLLLVPRHGAAGAAVANAFSYFVFLIARTELSCLVWQKIRRRHIYTTILIFLIIGSCMAFGEVGEKLYAARVLWLIAFPVAFIRVVGIFYKYASNRSIEYP